MCSINEFKQQQFEALQYELEDFESVTVFKVLKEAEEIFGLFDSWNDVIRFLKNRESAVQEKDDLLKAIIKYKKSNWQSVLLAVFWPRLEGLHKKSFTWDTDRDRRWEILNFIFISVINRIDVDVRKERIARKILNDTQHDFFLEYKKIWKVQEEEKSGYESEELENLVYYDSEISLVDEIEERVHYAQKLLDEGLIKRSDFDIYKSVEIDRESVSTFANEHGLKRSTASMRLKRTKDLVLKNFEKSCDRLAQNTPLYV